MGQPIFRAVDGSLWEILGGVPRELPAQRAAQIDAEAFAQKVASSRARDVLAAFGGVQPNPLLQVAE